MAAILDVKGITKAAAMQAAAANAAVVVQSLGPFMHAGCHRHDREKTTYAAALEVLKLQFVEVMDAATNDE